MAPETPREQEHSIKARKHELFAKESGRTGPLRRFEEYIRDTPPAPLSLGQKAALAAVGILVLLLLLAALLTGPASHRRAAPRGQAAVGH